MNFRTTLFLLVLVVIVGVGIYFKSGHEAPKSDKVEEHKLVDIDSADVTRVSITSADDKHTVLQKTGSDWKLVQPVAARAKSFEVDDLVRALVGLKSRGTLDASKKSAGGLDHPSFTVELTGKNDKTTKLSFGDSSAVGDSLYVLVNDGSKPEIVGNSIYATLDKPSSTYRDMRLINIPSSDIKQLAISHKGSTIKLEKKGEEWEIVEPAKIPAENSAVSELLSSITSLDATEYVETPSSVEAAKRSLARPVLTVSFSSKAPSTQPAASQPAGEAEISGGQTLRFGTYKDILKTNVFASLDKTDLVVVPATSEKSFEKTPLDLRNRDVVNITPDHVSSFTIAINKPATTQPTTQPAEMREFTIERHKVAAPVLGPSLPSALKVPTTQPTAASAEPSHPATQPAVASMDASHPTTQPAIASTESSHATTQPSVASTEPSHSSTEASAPATQPAVATTQPATQPDELAKAKWIFTSGGSGPAEEEQVTELLNSLHPLRAEKYLEPAKATGATYTLTVHAIAASAGENAEDYVLTFTDTGTQVEGVYKDLHFTVERSLLEKLTGDFKTKKPAATPSMPPPSFHGGSPFGG